MFFNRVVAKVFRNIAVFSVLWYSKCASVYSLLFENAVFGISGADSADNKL